MEISVLSTDEWIKKMWDTHRDTHEYSGTLLNHKKWNFAIYNNMDNWIEGYYTNWNVKQSKTNTVWCYLYVESGKYNKLVNITKKKQTHR